LRREKLRSQESGAAKPPSLVVEFTWDDEVRTSAAGKNPAQKSLPSMPQCLMQRYKKAIAQTLLRPSWFDKLSMRAQHEGIGCLAGG
jgi:hypothetical protein